MLQLWQWLKPHLGLISLALAMIAGASLGLHDTWPWWLGLVGLVGVWLSRYIRQQGIQLILLFVSVCCLMTAYSQWRLNLLDSPWLPTAQQEERHWLTGQIAQLERGPDRQRVVLHNVQLYGAAASVTLPKIRLSTNGNRLNEFELGDWLATAAQLDIPTTAAFPGDYNARQHAFFAGEGARGFIMGPIHRTSTPAEAQTIAPLWLSWQRWRSRVALALAPQQSAAHGVATALLTGFRAAVPEKVREAYRTTGLAHLLAISGLHLGLVAGLLFFSFRWLWACVPHLALRLNGRYPAAIVAWSGSAAYMLLAGASTPTLRAFTMLSLVFLAVLLNRFRFGLRVLGLAVIFLLLWSPWLVLTASFQLSVTATLALVIWAGLRTPLPRSTVKLMQPLDYTRGVWSTSVVAGLATLPLVAWHFSQVALSGLILNLLAIPLTAFWILPVGLLTLLSVPFEVQGIPLELLTWGTHWLNNLALWGSSWPGSGIQLPPLVMLFLTVVAIGALGLYILRQWRAFWLMLLTGILAATILNYWSGSRPGVVWLNAGQQVLVRSGHNTYHAITSTTDFTHQRQQERWLRRYAASLKPFSQNCDGMGCVIELGDQNILVVHSGQVASAEDCTLVDQIIGPAPQCPQQELKPPQKAVYSAWWPQYLAPWQWQLWQPLNQSNKTMKTLAE